MIQETFVAQQGFNSLFSEIDNFELVQNPIEEGFLSNTATLKKRPGLFTDQDEGGTYIRETIGEIQGKIILGGLAFFRDDLCNVYKFERIGNNYAMTHIYNNPAAVCTLKTNDLYGNKIKQRALSISYVSGIVSSWTADNVLSTNDDGNGNVVLVVNEAGTFSNASVGQYIYFTDTSSDAAKYQIRQIVEFIDDVTVYLSEQFYGNPSAWQPGETGETYDNIGPNIVFNNIRNSDGLVLCIDMNDNAYFRNLGGNDIEIFEGRFWYINRYGTAVGGSFGTGEYELLDPTTVLGASADGRGQRMDSLVLTKNYLLVNQETSVSVVWQIAATATSDPIYNLNSIINGDAAFSPDSIHYKGGLYYAGKDGLFEGGDIIAVSANQIYGETKNQGMIIQKYLNEIVTGTFVRTYDYGRGPVIQYVNGGKTKMLIYDEVYQGRLVWEYNLEIKDKFETFYGELLIGVGNKICLRKGNNDLGEDISVKCTVTGSKTNFVDSIFSFKKIKLSLGYYENIVKFKIRLDLGGSVFETKIEKDANGVDYLVWQNIAASPTALGNIPIGVATLGGINGLTDAINKVGLIGIPIGKKCSYYKLTIENIDNYDLNIVSITNILEGGNVYITPSANVF